MLVMLRNWCCEGVSELVMLPCSNFAAILPGYSVAGAEVADGFLNFYDTFLVARLVLNWSPNAPPAVVWTRLRLLFGYMHHGNLAMHLLVDAKLCSIAFRSHHCSWLRTNLLVYGWCFVFACYLHVAKQNFFSYLTSRVAHFYTCFLPQHLVSSKKCILCFAMICVFWLVLPFRVNSWS